MTGSGRGQVLLFGLVFFVFIALFGQVTRLICHAVGAGEPVNCVKKSSLFWLIPLGEEEIRGLQGATVVGCDCEDGGDRVELLTLQGNIPLNYVYVGYPRSFQILNDEASRINDFVSGEIHTHEMVITDGEQPAAVMLIAMVIFAWLSREKILAWLVLVYERRRPSP